jgi:CheY-like chemotaxis protein
MNNILIFEPSREHRKALTKRFRRSQGWGTRFTYYNPADVFTKKIPDRALAAFFTLESNYDIEAACKMGRIRKQIPIVAVSDEGGESSAYCLNSYGFGTCKYYLTRPFDEDELRIALKMCNEWLRRKKYLIT